MQSAADISWLDLAVGYIILIIPILVFRYYKTGLIKDTLISVGRMTVQLLLVGLYLEFIFKLNNPLINIFWVMIMIVISSFTIIKRSELSIRMYFFSVVFALSASIIIIDAFFLGVVIRLNNIFDARYLVPITGMLLGNCLQNNIIALNSYYSKLAKEQVLYRFSLANGATRAEALLPFMRDALKKSFNPTIANIAVLGLISLPGMMTGQILGGSNPVVAIKYQIMIMITIFVAGIITVVLTINTANKYVFDEFDNLKNAGTNR